MNSRKKIINELQFQLDSKEVKDQHYPVQLSASDANAILILLKEQPEIVKCKDCAYAIFKEGLVQPGHIVCTKPFTEHWQSVKPNNWFCANAERKEI